MRERKVVKFRVDMYDDTKFKIIDRKPERDLIHYAWTRFVILAGKVNLDGDLYLSKNIPYTIETLAIELNRDTCQIKLALDVLIELEMIELIEDKIYRVKNFAKHQNIKIKEKSKSKDKEEDISNKEVLVKEILKNENPNDEDKISENKIVQNEATNATNDEIGRLEIIHEDTNRIDNNMSAEKINNKPQDNIPMLLEVKKNKLTNKKGKKCINIDASDENVDEEVEDNRIVCFYDGDEGRHLGVDEHVEKVWSFN